MESPDTTRLRQPEDRTTVSCFFSNQLIGFSFRNSFFFLIVLLLDIEFRFLIFLLLLLLRRSTEYGSVAFFLKYQWRNEKLTIQEIKFEIYRGDLNLSAMTPKGLPSGAHTKKSRRLSARTLGFSVGIEISKGTNLKPIIS